MSGRLIILPKKTWHVWRRDNIERVKRDERLAAEAEEALEQKQRDIEQELRLETLKKRQHLSSSSSSGAPQAKPTGKNKYDLQQSNCMRQRSLTLSACILVREKSVLQSSREVSCSFIC
jgi:hypothetical protein